MDPLTFWIAPLLRQRRNVACISNAGWQTTSTVSRYPCGGWLKIFDEGMFAAMGVPPLSVGMKGGLRALEEWRSLLPAAC